MQAIISAAALTARIKRLDSIGFFEKFTNYFSELSMKFWPGSTIFMSCNIQAACLRSMYLLLTFRLSGDL